MPLHFPFLHKIKKKAVTNIRKTIYNKYIQYLQAINTSTMSSPFEFDKFKENTPYLSHPGEFKVLYLVYFLSLIAFCNR